MSTRAPSTSGQDLIEAEQYEEAILHFETLATKHPEDPRVLFHLAGAYDAAGHEERAVAPYQEALALGLDDEETLRAQIQLASTLRNLDRFDEAVSILTVLCAENPRHRAGRAFLALALTSSGQPERAVSELLDQLLANPGPVEDYARSLRWYTDELRESTI